MPSICRRIRTRLPTYLSTGLGTFVPIVISAALSFLMSGFKHECNRSHAVWRYPQPIPHPPLNQAHCQAESATVS